MTDIKNKFMDHIASYGLETRCIGKGNPNAKVVIIGDYPTINECALNKPLQNDGNLLLWKNLKKMGVNKYNTHCTHVVKRSASSMDKITAAELSLWQEALLFELSLLKPKMIICMGNLSINTLFDFNKIDNYRGSVYYYKNIPTMVIDSSTVAMRNPEKEVIFNLDMYKAKRLYEGDYKEMEMDIIINPSYAQAMDYISDIRNKHKRFSVDIELSNMQTACLGLGISAKDAMCINFRGEKTNRFTVEQEFNIIKEFAHTTDQKDTFVIAQNGNFDSYFMGYKDHCTFKVDFDTLLAHHTLYPKLPHGLGFLVSQYLDFPYYKDEVNIFKEGGDIDGFWEYNGKDCCTTFACADKLHTELVDSDMDKFFYNHVMRLQPHLSKSTTTGIKVDIDKKDKLAEVMAKDLDILNIKLQKKIKTYINEPDYELNVNSPKQVARLFYDKLKIKYPARNTDKKAREVFLKDPRINVEIKDILTTFGKLKEELKFLSTYVNTEIDADNRFRAEFKQFGVVRAPGRLSSGKTLWGSGGNAQNQPYRAYEMYLPDDGCVYIYFDLAQAEARYVAWDAWIEPWIQDFERARVDGGFDAHRSLAETMFKISYNELSPDDFVDAEGRSPKDPNCDVTTLALTPRGVSKRCRHGLNYRMHIARLAQTTGMSYAEAASNYHLYHKTNPELSIWWELVERKYKKEKVLFNSYGRRNIALGKITDDSLDSIIAFRPQSTIGDKTQRVWYQCHEHPKWDNHKARIALNVHDALYAIATPDYAKTALSIMKAYAEEPIMVKRIKDGKPHQMIVPADCKISVAGDDGQHRMSTMKDIDIQGIKI